MFHRFGIEYAAPIGLTSSWSGMPATGPFGYNAKPVGSNGINGIMLPVGQRLIHVYGSVLIKNVDLQILVRVVSGMGDNFSEVWNNNDMTLGNVTVDKIDVETPEFPADDVNLQGDGYRAVWFEYQMINSSSAAYGAGTALETQLTAITVAL